MKTKAKVKDARKAARKTVKVSELYGGGPKGELIASEYTEHAQVHRVLQERHARGRLGISSDGVYRQGEHEWKVPLGIRLCLKQPLVWAQIAKRNPWYVTWRSPKTGKRLKKYFPTAISGIAFIATLAQYVDKHAALVSKAGYDIPAQLRGKIPAPWKWCPRCMTARRFKAVGQQETFFAQRKEWDEVKGRYEFRDRQLRLLCCTTCGLSNRDGKMRRSNQPWEIRRFKKGVRRARPRTR